MTHEPNLRQEQQQTLSGDHGTTSVIKAIETPKKPLKLSSSIGLSSYSRSELNNQNRLQNSQSSGISKSDANDLEQVGRVARVHYEELSRWLYKGLNSSARLASRLTHLQSTDSSADGGEGMTFTLRGIKPVKNFQHYLAHGSEILRRRHPEFLEPDVGSPPLPDSYQKNQAYQPMPGPSKANPGPRSMANSNKPGGIVANDIIVPDKSTLVVDTNDAYDDQSLVSEQIDSNSSVRPPPTGSSERSDIIGQAAANSRRTGSLSSIRYISNNAKDNSIKNSNQDQPRGASRGPDYGRGASSDYERRISLMQSKIFNLEKELNEALAKQQSAPNVDFRKLQELEEEVSVWREFKQLEAALEDERQQKVKDAEKFDQEIQKLRRQISELNEKSNSNRQNLNFSSEQSQRLKAEVTELLDELRQMQRKQDDMIADKEVDQEIIRDLEEEVISQKKRYEAAKTELRNLKTNVNDEVISAMRVVINAVANLDEDVQQFELNSSSNSANSALSLEDQEKLEALKDRINSTLSNLITASKNHVVSFGLSPISLLDAAASHLSFSLIELVKLVGMRAATAAEIELSQNYRLHQPRYDDNDYDSDDERGGGMLNSKGGGSGSKFGPMNNSPKPLRVNKSRSREDLRSKKVGHDENSSATANTPGKYPNQGGNIINKFDEMSNASDLRDSASGSSTTNPDKVFDSPPRKAVANGVLKDPITIGRSAIDNSLRSQRDYGRNDKINGFGAGLTKAEEADREQLKVCNSFIVGHIQTLLSSIRSGATDGGLNSNLSDNLTQIITTVSSIVAITEDRLGSKTIESDRILKELSDNCNRLSEMLESSERNRKLDGGTGGFNKQTKQAMAAASFGVAKALKEL
ncbi:hypothetical protein PPACK8108_LOCUS19475 [Phakopsora pachyrhizi]|uniref:Cell polarity protein n=1 Tax=Phakopsora pachyrhizi TaxID=170000 RepID=A0AAV0BHI6_PHAPC|nr:hypothetical protein PPACK8108_LOCUS19475 [Phakopsora pachyrhizi]